MLNFRLSIIHIFHHNFLKHRKVTKTVRISVILPSLFFGPDGVIAWVSGARISTSFSFDFSDKLRSDDFCELVELFLSIKHCLSGLQWTRIEQFKRASPIAETEKWKKVKIFKVVTIYLARELLNLAPKDIKILNLPINYLIKRCENFEPSNKLFDKKASNFEPGIILKFLEARTASACCQSFSCSFFDSAENKSEKM